jgi:alkylresorcinol/alkylpyrone synthase
MPRILAVSTALPPFRLTQREARTVLETLHSQNPGILRFLRVFDRCGVETRHFAFPPEYYREEPSFERRNADYREQATALAERAARACLEKAKVDPEEVDHLFFVTTTGLATPSVDALLAPRLGLRRDVGRWPLFGLGCAGGAGGLLRAANVLRTQARGRALVVSVELCGQVFSPRATEPVDLVGTALFGDGAAAVLVGGDEAGSGPQVLASRMELFSESQELMGWRFTSDGMRLVLSQDVSTLVTGRLRPLVDSFLKEAHLEASQVAHWILHPGGRKIIEAYRAAFELGDRELEWTRGSLARVGNLSSASVLFMLDDLLRSGRPVSGDRALMVALGPGFAAEMLVLRW